MSAQWMCIPFAWGNSKVLPLSSMDVDWIGYIKPEEHWYYLDYGLLLIFGGIPWQVYFQRVLSSKSAGRAQVLSYVAAIGCIFMAIPPVLIGAIAKATRKSRTTTKDSTQRGIKLGTRGLLDIWCRYLP